MLDPSHRRPSAAPAPLALGAVLAAVLAAAGCDNPACIFGPDACRTNGGGPGGIGARSAVFPSDASWLSAAAPSVTRVAPGTTNVHPESPLIVEFDQSLDPASLLGGFELLDTVTSVPVPLFPPVLVGDGRAVVLAPATGSLQQGATYLLRFTPDQAIADVTGQLFDYGTNQSILEFAVAATPPAAPRVVYSYPMDGAINQSDLSEVVVAFDRKMVATNFTTASFVVTVNGAAPNPNPQPTTLFLAGQQIPIQFTQVWRWASADANAIRQSLGSDVDVLVRLSPSSNPLNAQGGGVLPTTDIAYSTAALRAPASVLKAATAAPADAVGGPNLAGGDVLEVTLADAAAAGDVLEVFVIGTSPSNPMALKAEQRNVTLSGGETVVGLAEAELDLLQVNGDANFLDGEIEFMTRLRRGASATVARRADANTGTAAFQRLVLDLTPPRLLGLGVDGTGAVSVTSKLAGIVIVGRASERVDYVRVSTTAGDNFGPSDDPPRVALASEEGTFVAAPVLGVGEILDPAQPAIDYTVEVFDRALNPGDMAAVGVYRQVGVVGRPGPSVPLPGPDVEVRVFDADTGALLTGALVMSHEEAFGAVTPLGSALTVAGGRADVPSATGGGATIVTAQLAGYDTTTFHGVVDARIDLPLARAAVSSATITGTVTVPFVVEVSNTTNVFGDNRFAAGGVVGGALQGCMTNPLVDRQCDYGPLAVRPRRIGLTTFFATDPNVSQAAFSAAQFLRGFGLRVSSKALDYGESALEQDITVSALEPVEAIDPHLLTVGAPFVASAAPVVTVESYAYGLEGAPVLGMGVTYSLTPDVTWAILGARATAAADGGSLETRRAIEPDAHLRAEVVDAAGNRIVARPRFSGTTADPTLRPPMPPAFLVPGSGGSTAGGAYNVEVADVLDAAREGTGLYRVTVTDGAGRRWHLWRPDTAGGTVLLSLPPVTAFGGTPLASGAQTARVSVWAWPTFLAERFLWADVERRYEAAAQTPAVAFTQG